MTTNGVLFAQHAEYQEFIEELREKSRQYSKTRLQNPSIRPVFTDPLDSAAFIDSLFTDYVNEENNVTEADILEGIENSEKGFAENEIFFDFSANVRKALEDFKKGKL